LDTQVHHESTENTTKEPETKAAIITETVVSRVRGEELLTGFKSPSTRVLTAKYKLGANGIYMVTQQQDHLTSLQG
jgi:hypothetical protein